MSIYRLGVFGHPVAHSRSPDIHARFAEQAGIRVQYEKILVPTGDFNAVAAAFLRDGTGFNVTLPCKRDAWQFVDESSEAADLAEAVNTVSVTAAGKRRGDNTDGAGLVNDLVGNRQWQIAGKKVLVLGAGGAVSGVLHPLLCEQPATLHVWNRTHDKAKALEARFKGVMAVEARKLDTGYDLVINGTSAGLLQQQLAIPGTIIGSSTRCYDMVYGSATTSFNAWCLAQSGCEVVDGLGMLVEQAALAFTIWFGDQLDKPLDTRIVISELRQKLQQE